MTNPANISDEAERRRALDPTRSFLVQAPAGSGKTELLVRRYLRLLATVREPEEILAVTFTRKAAAEMQARIVNALAATEAEGGGGSDEGLESAREIARLVAGVRRRDAERNWQLGQHPARLRISTIDALNAALARSAPVSAGVSALRPVSDQPERLYRLAARATLQLLTERDAAGVAAAALLEHLDNDPGRFEAVLAQLLNRRDQWLPLISGGLDAEAARQVLEASLADLVARELALLETTVPDAIRAELAEVVHAAAINREVDLGTAAPADRTLGEQRCWWQFASGVFITKAGGWRARLTVTQGFPPKQVDLKTHATVLLASMADVDGLLEALASVQALPAPEYSAAQWGALKSLLTLLPYAAAQLKLVFAAEGATDYTEVAAEARAALGDEVAPSDLALRVDWRLQHLLLDEFQDTSQAQYALLRALTRGWSQGDGRTVFLVGDPMQSIYRFRQAEVRLFLDVRDHGLPGIVLDFIRLSANFRSVPALVRWANETFEKVFPRRDDVVRSAISFSPATPARSGVEAAEDAVTLHACAWQDPAGEADAVVRVVAATLAHWPGENIGILVRSRSHASHIVAALRAANIELSATDLVELGRTMLATELLAITRALVHAGDRLAWLTVFRAPWSGLTLADLERLATIAGDATLFEVASTLGDGTGDPLLSTGLTADGRQRVARVTAAFTAGLARLGQVPLRDVVEGVWLELGGPAVAGRELTLADLILDEIGRHDTGGDCSDTAALEQALASTRASLPSTTAPVQVLTIHKAKGLQFDTVIIPRLGSGVRGDRRPVLLWQDLAQGGSPDLLLAPVNATGADTDPLYELLWDIRGKQDLAETDRLLYVAATRARERLHLFGQAEADDAGSEEAGTAARTAPAKGSLLSRLWPVLGPRWPTAAPMASPIPDQAAASADPASHWRQPVLRRLVPGWQRPPPPAALRIGPEVRSSDRALVVYDWASAWTRQAGSVAHRGLQQLALIGPESFTEEAISALVPRLRQLLVRQGVDAIALPKALERVVAVLVAAVRDPQAHWLLSREHSEQRNEYPVTVRDGNGFRQLVIDRAFVDADGIRWIVDYKTSSHEGGDQARFICSEVERYTPQLRAYRQAFAGLEEKPVRTALYFPLLQLLQTVDVQ